MIFRIYEIEKKIKTTRKFLYPHFEKINWFVAEHLYQEIKDLNVNEKKCPASLLTSLKALLVALKQWNLEKDVCIPFVLILNFD